MRQLTVFKQTRLTSLNRHCNAGLELEHGNKTEIVEVFCVVGLVVRECGLDAGQETQEAN